MHRCPTSCSLCLRGRLASTSAWLAARRLAPHPFHPRSVGDLSIGPQRIASQPSQPSRAHLVASLSLVPPLVLSCALPAEIRRRRPPRRGTATLQVAGARADGSIWHILVPRRAAALPDRRSGRRCSASGRPISSSICPGLWPGSSCAPLCLPTGQYWHADRCQSWQACLGDVWVRL